MAKQDVNAKKQVATPEVPATKKATPSAKAKTFIFVVKSIDTRINKNGKLTVKCEEGIECNPKGVFQFNEDHLNNFAQNLRATNVNILADAISASFDDSKLSVNAIWVEEGAPVIDFKTGEQVEDPSSDDGLMYHTTAHWRTDTLSFELVLGEDAKAYVADLNREQGLRELAEARKGRRGSKGSTAVKAQPKIVADETADETADDEDLG